ncbi:adaptor protein MecA [Aerococcus kribbianus]|uniref:Adaptor protein MecA n=1 Tax=Aerococcus kribbianus TaxID=2999064 RepID=A0A9X3FQA9_9LACT|nr:MULTISPECIES: adaptor protein MecA [unclassified Aerococcus]MCZ0717748.1 adaptor protein MecA [Aerococcus sp. YH-aer221]MCZ0726036.1 adaptor protein MecA [Aerococcus sp. YH-aer222]
MEMEYINENLIRVFIENSDMAERGISFIDLMSNQEEVEKFFMNILHEVDVSKQFENTEAITFQVLPKKGGIDLYISKAQEDGMPFQKDILEQIANNHDDDFSLSDLDQLLDDDDEDEEDEISEEAEADEFEDSPQKVFKGIVALYFNMFEDFLAFSQDFTHEHLPIDLYLFDNHYYIIIDFTAVHYLADDVKSLLASFSEFADKSDYAPAYIKEHGKRLIANNAPSQIKNSFNQFMD